MTGLRARPRVSVPASVRTALTVVDTSTSERVDVVLSVDPAAPVSVLERGLVDLLHPRRAGLWLGTSPMEGLLCASGVRTGSVIGLGGPVATAAVVSALELHVISGPFAGTVHAVEGELLVDAALLGDPGVDPSLLRAGPAGAVLGRSVVRVGEQLLLGSTLVRVMARAVAADVTVARDLGREVTRPPRLRAAPVIVTLELPEVPRVPEPRRLAILPLLLPVVLGVVMAFLSSPLFLLFTLMSPLMALGSWWSDRRQGKRSGGKAAFEHAAAMAAFTAELARRVGLEATARRAACPDPAFVGRTATGPGPRLWERRRSDDDSLLLRVGTGAAESETLRVLGGPAPTVADVPLCLPLREVGVLGVAGETSRARAVARWLVAQAAVLHSPRDLAIWLLVDPARPLSEPDWSWLRWLPHSTGSDECLALVGTTVDSLTARVAQLTAMVAARTAAARDVRSQLTARSQPDVLVVLDGARALRSLSGMPAVLRDGPAVGVHMICLEERELLLPEECQAVVTDDGTLHRTGSAARQVRVEAVTADWAMTVARALAPLRDAVSDDGEAQVPASARLLDVLEMDPPTAEGVRARWGRTTAAVVGVDADGPFTLDLRRDGPHVLVAGTTGAGKSELLQTLVASLAVANRPDAMTFVLVDYKGGAAFKDCARLPHTVGMVTDLDGHLVERALSSLTAELKTRELLLQEAGAKDIEDYWETGAVLPRLCIVIDEFASLVEELPDFVRGLVGIAQRGRSLGVHLVLATQRPSGVVSPEIRANTNLRLALRVTDAAESLDVLDAPDAATIAKSTPGRAYARTGHTSLNAFQSARVGGRRPGLVATDLEVREVPWDEVGLAPPAPTADAEPDAESTDLHALVEAIRAAADGVAAPRSPWLAALPESLALAPSRGFVVSFGLEDVPSEQRQQPTVLDLEHGSHLLLAGAPRSGRSTALRTIGAAIATACDPIDVHLYALDCGNGALLPLADLPHTGAVVSRTQVDRADRLLARLTAEVARRQDLLATNGWADLSEQRAAGQPLPYLVLLVDRWEGFTAAFDEIDAGRLTETFLRLLREGPAAGLRVILSGDRTALLGKVAHAIEDTLVLRLAERSDYSLAGLTPRQLPDVVGDGRCFRSGSGREVQIAQLAGDQAAAIARLAASMAPCREGGPFRIDALPSRITSLEASLLPRVDSVTLGVGGDSLSRVGIELERHGPGFTIAGPPRSGRSTALLGIAHELLAHGTTVCAITPRPSPLAGVTGLVGASDPSELAVTLNAARGPVAVLVDDAELLGDSPLTDLLCQVLREGRDQGHSVILAGTTADLGATFRGLAAEARKSRSGLLLGLTSHLDGELLGVRLPRSAVSGGPVGRALLVRSGDVTPVQVPLP